MTIFGSALRGRRNKQILIRGARYATGPRTARCATIQIEGERINRIVEDSASSPSAVAGGLEIDLSGFFVMPGLINAHDHLEFSLFPRLADPPYRNYIDRGEDIHRKFPDIIAKYRAIPKPVRLWWGGIRNLLCGVTTVSHHNPFWLDLGSNNFPVRVTRKYGWGHSLALGGDLRAAHASTLHGHPFIVHACEGVDEQARREVWELDQLSLLDSNTVLVHGLAIDPRGVALIRECHTSLIVCPSSNRFLYNNLPDLGLLGQIENLTLGNDSPLTAVGDLLDEVRFAIYTCNISPEDCYRMVTTSPAAILHLEDSEGSIEELGVADLIALRDTGQNAAERLEALSMNNIEFVMIRGRVQLASEAVVEWLPSPMRHNLEPLSVDGIIRWVRAPIKRLLRVTGQVLGTSEILLGRRLVRAAAGWEIEYVY